jgi:glycine cleavage system protein P-like pyridoxal-binding family
MLWIETVSLTMVEHWFTRKSEGKRCVAVLSHSAHETTAAIAIASKVTVS